VNLQIYTRVLWRFRYLMVAGLVLAVVIAIVSYATSASALYQAEARLFVTAPGFPIGTAQQKVVDTGGTPTAIGDPSRLTDVASLYAELASSDTVRRAALAGSGLTGKITAQVESTPVETLVPVVDVQAAVHSYQGSITLAERAARAFQQWVTRQEVAAKIPSSQRVLVQLIAKPDKPTVLVPKKKTLPIALFLIVLIVFIAAAFVLENLRPEPRTLLARNAALAPVDELQRAA